jgi:hypothetical protein
MARQFLATVFTVLPIEDEMLAGLRRDGACPIGSPRNRGGRFEPLDRRLEKPSANDRVLKSEI